MSNPLSVVINADAQQVWTSLREPGEIARWHGWEVEGLAEEIQEIYFKDSVLEAPDHLSLSLGGGDVFTLEPVAAGTRVSIVRAAPDPDSPWAAWEADITEGWVMFLHQLKFALERHPHAARRSTFLQATLDRNGRPALEILGLDQIPEEGQSYSLHLPTGEEITGRVWYKTPDQVGLTVHEYADHGDGLLIASAQAPMPDSRPNGGLMVNISSYGLGAHQLEALRQRWESWRASAFHESEPNS
ncbi:SRPBCC family protein [Pseudarthrobacter sp. J1738]|uniref:SRPBCC family protein n=1 Tax=Pseudarthrobacter sp. J1738 TaxID=3420446 RepID=UPI003D2C121D